MAFTDAGKKFLMDLSLADGLYISCHLANGTELSGNGYARKQVPTGSTVSAAGVISFTNLELWTASTATAQNPDQWAVYDHETAGVQVLEPTDFTTDVAAPANGQAIRLTATITP